MTTHGDYYYRKLPRRVQGRLEELSTSLQEIAADALTSIILHGSVARGDWVEETSDVDVIVVLKKAERETLERIGDALALARGAARVEAMILVESEIARAADVFPLYYQDIRDQHYVLHGSDPFAGLVVESAHIRLRVEQELRDVSIRMRRAAADVRGDPARLGEMVSRKMKQLRFPLRTLLRMLGEEVSDDLRIVIEKASKRFQVDAGSLARAHDRPLQAYDELALLLDRAIAVVDCLEERPAIGEVAPRVEEALA